MLYDPAHMHLRAKAATESGIQTPEGRILLALYVCGPLHLPALRRETGYSRSTCRTALQRLRDLGHIKGCCHVTPAGEVRLRQIIWTYRVMVAATDTCNV